jgi:hypothetical protein
MSAYSKRKKLKARSEHGAFSALPKAVIAKMQEKLTPVGYKLLIDLYEQYNGNNNGDLTPAWSVMKKKGWNSKDTLNNARKELINQGFIELTRQGTLRPHSCSLYAVTWINIDECNGKLDVKPTKTGSGLWRIG